VTADPTPAGTSVVHLVSCPFPSGVTWLVNALLALGIRTTHATFRDRHWRPAGRPGEVECEPEAAAHLRWHLPILHERSRFAFEPGVEVVWEHRLDFALQTGRPAILFVRDPRDALYSSYCRHYREALSLGDYLRRPDVFPHHFPGLLGLPPVETWAYFNLFWRGMGAEERLQVERFEDTRTDPQAALRRVLLFLGRPRAEAEIGRAVDCSSFARAKEAARRQAAATGETFRPVRRGQVGEWRERYRPEELAAFSPAVRESMREFGYAWEGEGEGATPPSLPRPPRPLSALVRTAATARLHLRAGDPAGARRLLRDGILRYAAIPSVSLGLAGSLLALSWTERLLTGGGDSRRAALLMRIFEGLNARFSELPSVRALIQGFLEEREPACAQPGRATA